MNWEYIILIHTAEGFTRVQFVNLVKMRFPEENLECVVELGDWAPHSLFHFQLAYENIWDQLFENDIISSSYLASN